MKKSKTAKVKSAAKTTKKVAAKIKPVEEVKVKATATVQPEKEKTKVVELTQTDKIKKFLTEDGLFGNCNTALKAFTDKTGLKVTYANFRRTYITFNGGVNILQEGPTQNPHFRTLSKRDRHDIEYFVWENIPIKEQPDLTHIGMAVLVAEREVRPDDFILKTVHFKGEKGWPTHNGYTLFQKSTEYNRCFIADQVRLHPSLLGK